MRIGLASDTHGSVEPLERALAAFARARVDRVYFLGGRLADLDAALARRRGAARAASPEADAGFLAAVEDALSRQLAAGRDPVDGRIVRVASRACAGYADAAARKQVDLVDGRICCLVHDKAELTRDDIANAALLFHGNADAPALVRIGTRAFVTPGRLGPPARPGATSSFAVLEVTARELVLAPYAPSGEPLPEQRASLGGPGGKVSVRG